ncbi:hypothetical protein [Candidatus Spongiihabitans sp.]
MPGLFRAIQLLNSAALAAIISAAKPPVFRAGMTRRRACCPGLPDY